MNQRTAAILAIVVVFLGATASGAGGVGRGATPVPLSVTGWVNVSAVADYGYQPDTFANVPTNATIIVTFTDLDVLQHAFTIVSREGFEIPTNYSDSQLSRLIAAYPPLDYALVNGKGDVNVTSFHSPATPGWYEFVCNVTGHFALGMYGFIAFGMNLPINLTLPNHTSVGGPAFDPVELASIGGAVLLALLVVYFIWWYRTPSRRPPPGSNE